jgi:hypothetical protein
MSRALFASGLSVENKKPTWLNTLRYPTTSVYSLTSRPLMGAALYLVVRRLRMQYTG